MNIWNLVYGIETGLALLILIYVVRLSFKSNLYWPLSLYIIISIYCNGIVLLTMNDLLLDYPFLIDTNEPFYMLYGVFLFLYARNQVNQKLVFKRNDLLILIPFILSVLVYLPDYFSEYSLRNKDISTQFKSTDGVMNHIWEWNFYLLVNGFFLFLALRELKVFNVKLKYQLSSIKLSNLYYTNFVIKICLGLFICEFIYVYAILYGLPFIKEIPLFINFLCGLVLLIVGLDAIISHKSIKKDQSYLVDLPVSIDSVETAKYSNSILDQDTSALIGKQLLEFMEENKPYLTPKLLIKDLADLMDLPAYQLSQVINQSFDQNFFEFVNKYRVNDAMKMLKDPQFENYTYEAIAFEVGFNSRSAFYSAFKKVNNMTPSKYQKQ